MLFARVTPEHLAQVQETCKVLGVGLGEYMDYLIERDRKQLDHRYRPRHWRGPLAGDQDQLPLARETEESPLKTA